MKTKVINFYKRSIRIIPGVKSYLLAAVLVFAVGLAITLLSWYLERQRVESQQINQLNAQVLAVENSINNRLSIYEQILRGAGGAF